MNCCFLKIAYGNRIKKYRYYPDKPINFNQIRKQLIVTMPPEIVRYEVVVPKFSRPKRQKEPKAVQRTDTELVEYLRSLPLLENEAIKVRIAEAVSCCESESSEEQDLVMVPASMDRGRSKSQDYNSPTTVLEIQTGTMEVTQEFLYNSGIELAPRRGQTVEEIERQLLLNAKRMRLIEEKRRRTKVEKLFQFIERQPVQYQPYCKDI